MKKVIASRPANAAYLLILTMAIALISACAAPKKGCPGEITRDTTTEQPVEHS